MEKLQALEQMKDINEHFPPGRAIEQWKSEDKKVIGWLCTFIPEEVIHAGGMLPVRLTAESANISAANGKITHAPDMDRRIETYRRYHQGFGEILVQMNVEDTRLGVAEYVSKKHGLETIELKWGQGAKCIGGEIKVNNLERALELQKRGYIVTPDPSDPIMQAAFKDGAIKEFERHSRLGFVDEQGFYAEVERLRNLGFKRITLKTGAYGRR